MIAPDGSAGPKSDATPHDDGSRATASTSSLASPNGHSDRPPSRPSSSSKNETPLPTVQLAVLAVIALAEQTALNSISPYLPDMASSFPEVEETQAGVYVGLIASSFALAQFATNFFWGWLSDRIGRKPVVMTGTILTAACMVAFGFCRTLWQAILVQMLMGTVNGNQGVVATCLGEITDRSNQSKAFQYLPVVYGIGGITGPIVGGLLVTKSDQSSIPLLRAYPYLAPNLFSAAVLMIDFGVTAYFLEESIDHANEMKPLGRRVGNLFAWLWQFAGFSQKPTFTRPRSASPQLVRHSQSRVPPGHDEDDDDEAYASDSSASDNSSVSDKSADGVGRLRARDILDRDTLLILTTYFIFQLCNIAYNSLYPIFAQAPIPTGRNLSPQEIGLSLAFAGLVTIVFQLAIFGRLRNVMGNKTTYRLGLAGFLLAFLLMPWIGYKDSRGFEPTRANIWLWVELAGVLTVKTVAAVGGLTSALLLITNSAPDHTVLGALNGLAQTLSAAGRAVGPFISGGLFTLATRVRPKGEALVFGIFGGVSFVGLLISIGIRGVNLEDYEWDAAHGDDDEADEAVVSVRPEPQDERTPLLDRGGGK